MHRQTNNARVRVETKEELLYIFAQIGETRAASVVDLFFYPNSTNIEDGRFAGFLGPKKPINFSTWKALRNLEL